MKKIIPYTLSFVLGFFGMTAQQDFNCASHLKYEQMLNTDPVFRKNTDQLEKETELYVKGLSLNKTAAAPAYIIPVVFHVIHTGGPGNISDAQIIDQIQILNKEFNRLQADTVLTPGPFKSLAAPFAVEFRLATLDPNGNCTNGINRIYSSLSDCSLHEDDVKALSYWPSDRYLNIWITQIMHYSGTPDCVGGGYATFPGGNPLLDGINIRGDLISNIGTAATNGSWGNFKGRYLIHELGHWFNLRHIWGDATCGNDQVSDTPTAVGANSGCPSFPHNAFSSCSGSGANGEMFTNYMDYTNGPCLNMFSVGQVARMTAAMNSLSTSRHLLYTTSNLNATGTNNPYTYPVACVAVPEVFPYGSTVVCVGDTVKLIDISYGGLSTSRQWAFSGNAYTSSLSDSMVKISYASPGTYSYSLTKNYLGNSKTVAFLKRIIVLDNSANPNYVVPFVDDLENTAVTNDWVIINKDNDAAAWELQNSTSYSGDYCFALHNYGSAAPLIDELISPSYDLTNVLTPTLSFKMHCAATATTNTDRLQVFISKNCGATWTPIYTSGSNNIRTVNQMISTSYTPAPASNEWRTDKINIQPALAKGVVRFKFSFTSGGGNNIFIDDINVNGINTTDLSVYEGGSELTVYPNPASDYLELDYETPIGSPLSIVIRDISGRVCLTKNMEASVGGKVTEKIALSNLSNGVYLVEAKQEGTMTRLAKFVKQSND